MPQGFKCIVSGRVQGVYFRASTQAQAEPLGIHGWAKNLADGSVEVVAQGEAKALNTLKQWLKNGPPMARVDNLDCQTLNPSEILPTKFQVL